MDDGHAAQLPAVVGTGAGRAHAAPASAPAVISRLDGWPPTRYEAKALQVGRRPL